MESFNTNLQGGKKLVKALEKQTVRPCRERPRSRRLPPPHDDLVRSRASDACAQPVSVLQAPATPAMVAAGATDDAPTLLVGSSVSNLTGGRSHVINASSS